MEKIWELFKEEINERFYKESLDINDLKADNIEFSDNFGELWERLLIIHIRVWRMEDLISSAKTDTEIADLKRKIDWIFKFKRPKLIKTLNLMLDNYITNNKPFKEENLKEYTGFKQ